MTDEIIGSPKVVASADTRAAAGGLADLAKSGENAEKILTPSFERISRSSKQTEASIRTLGASITGSGATQKFGDLAVAVERAGGVSEFAGKRLELLASKIKALEAAGGQAPAALRGIAVEASKLQEVTSELGTEKLKELAGSFGPIGQGLASLGPVGLAAAAGVGAVVENVVKFAEFGHEVELLHEQTALSTSTIQEFRFAAGGAGVSVEGLTGLVGKMDTALERGSPAFEKIGLDFRQLKEESPDEALHNVLEGLEGLSNEQQKIAVGRELFGRQFQGILPAIEQLERLKTVMHEAGVEMGEEDVAAAAHLGGAWRELGLLGEGLSNAFAAGLVGGKDFREDVEALVPIVEKLAKALRIGGEAAAFVAKYSMPGVLDRARDTVANYGSAAHDYATGNHPEDPGLSRHAPKPPSGEPEGIKPPTLSEALATGASGGKALDRATASHLKALSDEAAAKQEVIKFGREYAEALAAEATGLDATVGKIQAQAQAERDELAVKAAANPAIAAKKAALLEEIDAIERVKIANAQAVAQLKVEVIASKEVAAAERLKNESMQAGMSTLDQALQKIEAKRRAEIDSAHQEYMNAAATGADASAALKAAAAHVAQANATAAGDKALAKETQAKKDNAVASTMLEGSYAKLATAQARGNESLHAHIAAIQIWAEKDIQAAREQSKLIVNEQERARVLAVVIGLINAKANAEIKNAKAMAVASAIGKGTDLLGAGIDAAQHLGMDPNSKAGKILNGVQETGQGASMFAEGYAKKDPVEAAIGAIKTAVGLFDSAKAIFGGKSGWQKTLDDLTTEFGKAGAAAGGKWSEELAKAIDQDSKRTKGDKFASTLLHLGDVIKEGGGIQEFGVEKATIATRDLFTALARGALTTQDVAKSFNDVFGDVAQGNISTTTGIASAQLRELVNEAQRFKIESPALRDYLKSQTEGEISGLGAGLSSMKGLRDKVGGDAGGAAARATRNRLKDSGLSDAEIDERVKRAADVASGAAAAGVGIVSQNAALAIGASVADSFQQLLDQGLSRSEAMAKVTPLIESLRTELKASGYEGGAAFAQLDQWAALAAGEITGPLLSSVSGFTSALVSMSNSNRLTAGTFTGMTEQISANIAALAEQGVVGPQAVQALQPDLQKIWELEQQYHYEVDAGTQALIDQGVQAGDVGEAHRSAADKMIAASEATASAMIYLAEQFGYVASEADKAMRDRHATSTMDYRTTGTPPPPGSTGGGGGISGPPDDESQGSYHNDVNAEGRHYYKYGSAGLRDFGAGTPAMLHGWEAVVTKAQYYDPRPGINFAGVGSAPARAAVSAASVAGYGAGSAGAGAGAISVSVESGAIVINGATDPERTAAAVAMALRNRVAPDLVRELGL